MVSLLLISQATNIIYLILEIVVVFGGAMFFAWAAVRCVRLLIVWVNPEAERPAPEVAKRTDKKAPNLVELRMQVETIRLQTEQLRLEQEKMRRREMEVQRQSREQNSSSSWTKDTDTQSQSTEHSTGTRE